MQVGADDVVAAGPLRPVLAVVAPALAHAPEGAGPRAQPCEPRVVLVADDGAEVLRLQGDVADEALRAGDGPHVQDADALQLAA